VNLVETVAVRAGLARVREFALAFRRASSPLQVIAARNSSPPRPAPIIRRSGSTAAYIAPAMIAADVR
jgi:hypothetical protein